jgi:hypothetical protein
MIAETQKFKAPQPEDFGLEGADLPGHSFEQTKLGGLAIPKRLSPRINWVVGLTVAVPLALWTLWGLIKQIDSLALGITFGVLAAIVVFQLAISVVPLSVDASLHGLGLLVDEVAALFSDKARARIAYRKALRAYRNELARGGFER